MSLSVINWTATSAMGGIVSALAGVASAVVAYLTVRKAKAASAEQGALLTELAQYSANESRNLSRVAIANETYDRYLALCIRYPWLASYRLAAKTYQFSSARSAWQSETRESERYFWFLSYALNAFERILIEERDDPSWRVAVRAQLNYHADALAFLWTIDFRNHYSDDLSREVIAMLEGSSEHA